MKRAPAALSTTVAVVSRESPKEDWFLQTWAVNADVGRSSARFTCEQEGWTGNRAFESKVLSEKDADEKRYRVQGLAQYRASDFPERPTERIRVRVAPLPLPITRPAPAPLVLQRKPLMIKVQKP